MKSFKITSLSFIEFYYDLMSVNYLLYVILFINILYHYLLIKKLKK